MPFTNWILFAKLTNASNGKEKAWMMLDRYVSRAEFHTHTHYPWIKYVGCELTVAYWKCWTIIIVAHCTPCIQNRQLYVGSCAKFGSERISLGRYLYDAIEFWRTWVSPRLTQLIEVRNEIAKFFMWDLHPNNQHVQFAMRWFEGCLFCLWHKAYVARKSVVTWYVYIVYHVTLYGAFYASNYIVVIN